MSCKVISLHEYRDSKALKEEIEQEDIISDIGISSILEFMFNVEENGGDRSNPDFLLDCENIMGLMIAAVNRLQGNHDPNIQVLDALRV